MASFKCGLISILGRPNVGKSTLFNHLLGDKIAIVAEKQQTTRNRILGIKNVEGGQLIFLDTPGIHQGRSELNQRMVRTAIASGRDADVLLFLIAAMAPHVEKDQQMVESLRGSTGVPFLVINKIDLVKKPNLLPIMDQYQTLHSFRVSVTRTIGTRLADAMVECDRLLATGVPHMPVRRASPAKRVVPPASSRRPEDIPFDDEPLTPAEPKGILIGRRQLERGESVTLEEYERDLARRSLAAHPANARSRVAARPPKTARRNP